MLNKKGFTLIEVLIVLAIIGILAAIIFSPPKKHVSSSSSTSSEYNKPSEPSEKDILVQTITGITKVEMDREKSAVTIYSSTGVYAYQPVKSPELKIEYSSTNVYKKIDPSSLSDEYYYYFK